MNARLFRAFYFHYVLVKLVGLRGPKSLNELQAWMGIWNYVSSTLVQHTKYCNILVHLLVNEGPGVFNQMCIPILWSLSTFNGMHIKLLIPIMLLAQCLSNILTHGYICVRTWALYHRLYSLTLFDFIFVLVNFTSTVLSESSLANSHTQAVSALLI